MAHGGLFFICFLHRCNTAERIIEIVSVYGSSKDLSCDDVTSHSRADSRLTFIPNAPSFESTEPKHTGSVTLSGKRDYSAAKCLFSTACKKLKLKTDTRSAVAAGEPMKNNHPEARWLATGCFPQFQNMRDSQEYSRSLYSQRVRDNGRTVWWLKRTRPSPPKTLLLLWDTRWRRR